MKIILISIFVSSVFGNEIRIRNNCPFTIWPAITGGIPGNPVYPNPEGGGFQLGAKQTRSFNVPSDWTGRIWGRTECDGNGRCKTGDCGKIGCQNWGQPDVTLFEIKLNAWGNQDFYDISNVDAFNLGMRVNPIPGTFKKALNGKYDCNPIDCSGDILGRCPPELAVKSNGRTIACLSACTKFRDEAYCCSGSFNDRNKCVPNRFPHNYPTFFKGMCPDAYSWAFDDATSTFTCHGNPQTGYEIIFCP